MKSNSRLLWQLNGVIRVLFWFGLAIALCIAYNDITNGNEYDNINSREIMANITLQNADDKPATHSLIPADTMQYSALKPVKLYVSKASAKISVHPETTFATILLVLQNYSPLIAGLIILRLLNLLLARLEKDFSFNEALPRYMRYIANTLIIYQIVAYVTDKLIEANFAKTLLVEKAGTDTTKTIMEITAGSSTSFIAFFAGLLLLIIAQLLKQGYQLQQENELTI
nr:DUF2975 domain-containing protein [uncultured Flavobacterium sp.]